jgi:hypothetical protein
MRIRRSPAILAVIGAVLIGSALLVRLVAVPVLTRLPGSLDVKLHYAGTADVLNAQALQNGDSAHVFLKRVPTTIDRRLGAGNTTAHTAVVTDAVTLTVAGNASPQHYAYALDRTTLRTVPAAGVSAAEPPTGCLAVAFPLHPKADNSYTVYDTSTQQCFPVTYIGAASRGGRSAYEYTATFTGGIKDPQLLHTLPAALPKQTFTSLAPQLPEAVRAQLIGSLAALPDPVPLSYTARTTLHVFADRATGLPLDETLHQQVLVGVQVAGQRAELIPVLDLNAAFTPDTVSTTADLARSTSTKLAVIGIVIPAVLGALGLLFLVLGVLRRRPSGNPLSAIGHEMTEAPTGTVREHEIHLPDTEVVR